MKILSLSGTVQPEELPAHTQAMALFEIRPVGDTPNPSLFRSRATLDSFARVYRGLLSELERTHKSVSAVHLFLAAPVTAAIVCGRSLMRDAHPSLVIYDRIGGEYRKAVTVNERGSL